jgi:hypothetical protein
MNHIGIDVHKRESQIYILAEGGEVIEQRIRTEAECCGIRCLPRPAERRKEKGNINKPRHWSPVALAPSTITSAPGPHDGGHPGTVGTAAFRSGCVTGCSLPTGHQ